MIKLEVKLENRPGSLCDFLTKFKEAKINLADIYSFPDQEDLGSGKHWFLMQAETSAIRMNMLLQEWNLPNVEVNVFDGDWPEYYHRKINQPGTTVTEGVSGANKYWYLVQAITSDDDEVAELKALGLDIECKNGSQLETEFTVELMEEQATSLKTHPAVTRMRRMW